MVLTEFTFMAADTCGQQATAFVNPGNILRSNVFKHIRNDGSHGVQPIWVNAVYLDDQVAGWELTNNSFCACAPSACL